MRQLSKIINGLIVVFSLTSLVSCNKPLQPNSKLESDIYVQKVEGLKSDFIKGIDASSLLSLENSGVEFYNFNNEKSDPLKVMAQSGVNYLRVRVWNDPFDSQGRGYGGGNCNIDTAVELGKRATKYGMKLLVDFHYSDFWADPVKQMVPKAWKDMDIEAKSEALYKYTYDCLKKLKKAKVDVGMVQLGNETNGSMCGETVWMNIYKLMAAGSKACRDANNKIKVAVHFANPESPDKYKTFASKLDYYNLDYDVFGSSYYPYWHGTLDNLKEILTFVTNTYDKEVMVVENSYAYTSDDSDFFGNTISDGGAFDKRYPFTIQGQTNEIRDVIATVNECPKGIGVFYWEGAWITVGGESYDENLLKWDNYGSGWASSFSSEYDPNDAGKYYGGSAVDNQALFDKYGKPLESLKVFNLVNYGNEVDIKADAIEDAIVICDLNGEIVLPNKVNAIMNDNSRKEVDVTWHDVDFDKYYNGGVKKYEITGTAGGMTAKCYLSMVEYNFLENYSFETGDTTGWEVEDIGGADQLYVEEKITDSLTGEYHMHFWSEKNDSIEFTLQQKVKNIPTGTYKYSISIMGGDGGETDIYSYVKINGIEVARQKGEITSYGNWNTLFIDDISYTEGQEIIIGIYVKCSGSGNGAWGKIDDALLNSKA